MAKPVCPICGANVNDDGAEPWGLWRINRGRRLCSACHTALQFRRNVGTIYLIAPIVLVAQVILALAVGWGWFREGVISIGEAKLIVPAFVGVPLCISIALLMILPGSIYERSKVDGQNN